jgi:RNA polymerase sigma factor (sigma-70 family)
MLPLSHGCYVRKFATVQSPDHWEVGGNRTSRLRVPRRLQVVNAKAPFELVVAGHGATVLRVCRAMLDASDADDAWSETFLSAFRAYPDLPADANVEAWLVTIAHRKAIDLTRATSRRAIPVDNMPDSSSESQTDGRAADLADAVSRLPAKQKQVIAYHYLAGLPYADIGAIVGGSTEAARRAAADGIATLRRTYPGSRKDEHDEH